MILDKLENADWYFGCVPGFQQFMQFFNNNDLEELPACKIKLDGQDLIVIKLARTRKTANSKLTRIILTSTFL